MKKVFLILTLFLSCYFVYTKTEGNKKNYLVIGDSLSKGINEYGVASYGYSDFTKDFLEESHLLKSYNNSFANIDYKVSDIVTILEYNKSKNGVTLNRLIKEADIITMSIGIQEIYYKIDKNNQNIYTYIDTMINNYNKILNYINKCKMKDIEINVADVAASFQKAVVDVLKENVFLTCERRNINKIAIAGGVASNSTLREELMKEGKKKGVEILFPDRILCTDNAAMIGSAAYYEFIKGNIAKLDLNAKPNLKLGES